MSKKISALFLTCLLLFSHIALGKDLMERHDSGLIKHPLPCLVHGRQIPVLSLTPGQALKFNVKVASSIFLQWRGPVIMFNYEVLRDTPPRYQHFVFAHECAHVQLGHVYTPRSMDHFKNETIENNADCSGAHRLREEYEFTNGDFEFLVEMHQNEEFLKKVLQIPANAELTERFKEATKRRVNHFKACLSQ